MKRFWTAALAAALVILVIAMAGCGKDRPLKIRPDPMPRNPITGTITVDIVTTFSDDSPYKVTIEVSPDGKKDTINPTGKFSTRRDVKKGQTLSVIAEGNGGELRVALSSDAVGGELREPAVSATKAISAWTNE